MGHPALKVESLDGSTQVTIDGLIQLTVTDSGVVIDLADKHVEIERLMSRRRLVVTRNDPAERAPA